MSQKMDSQIEIAEQLKKALDLFVKNLEYPMLLGAMMQDPKIKSMVGALAADIIMKIDMDVMPEIERFILAHK
ncbi:MAG: hypothetical protein ACRCYS_07430 [Beijerinckiaceae bacterium]